MRSRKAWQDAENLHAKLLRFAARKHGSRNTFHARAQLIQLKQTRVTGTAHVSPAVSLCLRLRLSRTGWNPDRERDRQGHCKSFHQLSPGSADILSACSICMT